jgi:hypothetical protein
MSINGKVTANGYIESQSTGGGGNLDVDGSLSVGGTAVATKTSAPVAVTSDSAITVPGVYTLSGSAVITVNMPAVAEGAGGLFIFRSTSVHAHVLTASAGDVGGVNVFAGFPGGVPDNNGWQLSLPAVEGSSVALIGDGARYLLTAVSGSSTISSP